MDWAKQRASLIVGIGAIVVAAVALGVAVANGGSSRHERPMLKFADRYFGRSLGPGFGGPFGGAPGGGPMKRQFQVAPRIPGRGGPFARPFAPGPSFAGPLAGVLHGEGTVAGPNGKYETVDIQRGTVTKITSNSITVRSSDGFTRTYAVSKALLRGVAKGDQVQLRALVSHGKATVMTLASFRVRG